MRMIEKMIEALEDEIHGAKKYAEKYIENMAKGNNSRAVKYKEMAQDELKHAGYVRDFAMMDIDEMRHVYKMTEAETEMWEHGHRKMMDEMAMVKHMLSM